MESHNTPSNGSQNILPKDTTNTNVTSPPPPAYTPRRQSDIAALANRVIQAQRQLASVLQPSEQEMPIASLMEESHDDEGSDDTRSSISLRINTAVNVTRHNNIVCLPATPADQANAIARAVVQALHDTSSGQCGIPMIDEQGCPRPLKIEVEAGLIVEGSGNVVGGRELVAEVLRRRGGDVTSPISPNRRSRDRDEEGGQGASPKRRRLSQ